MRNGPGGASAPEQDARLQELLAWLREIAWQFTPPTPLTHARVLARRNPAVAASLRDVLGWSLPFGVRDLPVGMDDDLLLLLGRCNVLEEQMAPPGLTASPADKWFRSSVRCASFDDLLFLHSAYPTHGENAVFWGPDTYRFLRLIQANMPAHNPLAPGRVLDMGCGSGAGGMVASRLCPGAQLLFNDINPLALRYASINAQAAGLRADLALGDACDTSLGSIEGFFSVIVANPPYLVDDAARAYRHGGDNLGRALGVRMASAALQRLAPLGRLIMYTGVAIVDGRDPFIEDMRPLLAAAGCAWTYSEIDPDVFGEELERPAYRNAERIAAVGLVAVKA
jgi:SAM-dependent methyltransferase